MTNLATKPDWQCREPGCTRLARYGRGRCIECYLAAAERTRQRQAASRLANLRTSIERHLAEGAEFAYLERILPAELIPEGVVVVHNNVRPRRRLGYDGFRAWVQAPDDRLVICLCGWAPEAGVHYRIGPEAA
jgi:hypothetical protein